VKEISHEALNLQDECFDRKYSILLIHYFLRNYSFENIFISGSENLKLEIKSFPLTTF
jgi:hypothetical protein